MATSDEALQRRLHGLESRIQSQAREIRALEKIESLQDRNRALEEENRKLREKVEELTAIWNLSRTLAATLNLDELFHLPLCLIGRSLHVDTCSLMRLEEGGSRLVTKAAFGVSEERLPDLSLRLGEGISGLVAQTGQPVLVPDLSAEPRFMQQASLQGRGSFICVPLRGKAGAAIGVLNAYKAEPHAFASKDLDLFQAVANEVAVALEKAQLYQRTKDLSARDDLTGLFNRRYFFEQLGNEVQRARRYRRVFSLLVAAEKIRAAVERHSFFGRSWQPGGKMTVTIGVATYPEDSADGRELVVVADRAMYAGKQRGAIG